jgi:hypothetical protein
MKKILSFDLFEAKMSSHFDKRLKERIIDLKEISLNTPQADEIEKSLESEIGKKWKLLLINSIIENTEKRILKKIKSITFSKDVNFGVPISSLFLDFNKKMYPIEIVAKSTKGNDKEQSTYMGSQIWVSVCDDTAWTLKVFNKSKNLDSIASNMKSGVDDRFKNRPFKLINLDDDTIVKFKWNPGNGSFESNDVEIKPPSVDYETVIPERKTISPGDTIGLIIKGISPDKIIKGKVQEITNMGEIKDKQKASSLADIAGIKLSFLPAKKEERIVSNGREIPFVSTLKPGSIIEIDGIEYTILGPEGGKPLVTSEPSIIKSGKVQTWVERSTSSS